MSKIHTQNSQGQDESHSPRLIEEAEAEELLRKIQKFADPTGKDVIISLRGWWQAELRWARNRVTLASDRRDLRLRVDRRVNGVWGSGVTNQLDDYSIKGIIDLAERTAMLRHRRSLDTFETSAPVLPEPTPLIWSDATFNSLSKERADLTASTIAEARSRELVSAGYTEVRGGMIASLDLSANATDNVTYNRFSQAQCSLTVLINPRLLS